MDKWNLSDKIQDALIVTGYTGTIKRLKLELRGIPVIEEDCEFYQDFATISNRIDKLSGEELIK